ncbi:MAG: hypothetical protein HFG33_00360 [Bacilli bacterium]|nr:hypothetical protein [Bacilli bacterium]
MGTIKHHKKWDLQNNVWKDVESGEKGKALSTVSYSDIINSQNRQFNYIVIANGYRVENITKNPNAVSDRAAHISNVIKYFSNLRENYKIEMILIDNDAPLTEQSKAIAEYIDTLSRRIDAKTVNFLGFSKCGVIAVDMIKYFKDPRSFVKTRIYSISSPYEGTLIASPKLLEIEVKKMVEAKLGQGRFSSEVYKAVMGIFFDNFSNSHMDLDIAVPGGVTDDLKPFYDPSFLENALSSQNLKSLGLISHYRNICTTITEDTLKEAIKSGNLASLGLCILNDCLFDGKGDGIVPLSSQRKIDDVFNTSSIIIPSTHNSMEIKKGRTLILDEVRQRIEKS